MYPNTHIPSCRKKTYLKIWWQSPNSCQSLKVESTLKQLQLIYPLPKTLPAVSQVIITAVLTRHIGRLTEIACRKAGKEQSVLPFRSAPLPAARPHSAGRPRLPLCLPVPGPACWPQFRAGTAEQDPHPGEPKGMRWSSALALSSHVTSTQHIWEALLAIFHFICTLRGWLCEVFLLVFYLTALGLSCGTRGRSCGTWAWLPHACGIFVPWPGIQPTPLHWQADS